jgi:DNA-binding MarR family transcriptional regulator
VTAAKGHGSPGAPERGSCCDTEVRIEQACRRVIEGRRAARAIAEWAARFELADGEFHVLWCLRSAASTGLDQTTLAANLAISPAQVSAMVERLRQRDWISQQCPPHDRRRRLWRLSVGGGELLEQMIAAAVQLGCDRINDGGRGVAEVAA